MWRKKRGKRINFFLFYNKLSKVLCRRHMPRRDCGLTVGRNHGTLRKPHMPELVTTCCLSCRHRGSNSGRTGARAECLLLSRAAGEHWDENRYLNESIAILATNVFYTVQRFLKCTYSKNTRVSRMSLKDSTYHSACTFYTCTCKLWHMY